MITEVNIGEIDRSSDFAEKSFGFVSSAKGFKILTSKLYENPPYSVIQELSANAYDSHVMAGHPDKQFEVHIPTRLDPYFSIRDFGVSMDHEFMMSKYTLVFYSTKTQTNDANGAWGLGRLTGLACSDTYLVYTFLEGKKRTYNIFINEKGVPAIAFINEDVTTEPNGVEVNIPVPDSKISEFVNSATKIYRNYNIKPLFKGQKLVLPTYNFTLQGTDWALERVLGYPVAVMGVYHYPIQHRSIPSLTPKQVAILSTGFFLYYKIGDLDVTASRDGLSYEEKTLKAIKERLTIIQAEFDVKVQAEFDKCKTLLEAYNLHYRYYNFSGDRAQEGRLTSDKFVPVWNGIKIDKHSLTVNSNGVQMYRYIYGYTRGKNGVTRSYQYRIDFHNGPAPEIYINDLPDGRGIYTRMRVLMEDAKNTHKSAYVFDFASAEIKDKFLKEHYLDKFEIKKVSDIPKPPTIKSNTGRVYTAKSFKKVFKFTNKGPFSSKHSDSWEIASVDLENGSGIYVLIDRYIAQDCPSYRFPSEIHNYVSRVTKIDPNAKTPEVYGIKLSQKDKIGKNWVSLNKYISDLVEAKVKTLQIDKLYTGFLNYQAISRSKILISVVNFDLKKNKLSDKTVLHDTVSKINIEKELHTEFNTYSSMFAGFLNLPNVSANIDTNKLEHALYKAYPMFRLIFENYYYGVNDLEEAFVEYANALAH